MVGVIGHWGEKKLKLSPIYGGLYMPKLADSKNEVITPRLINIFLSSSGFSLKRLTTGKNEKEYS